MESLERTAHTLLRKNRVEARGVAYTRPGGKYLWQWFWDSCLHALVWRHFDVEFAKRELLSLFRHQEESGFVPHMSFHPASLITRLFWGRPSSSGLIQPPIVAEAVWAVYEIGQDREFLRSMYPRLAQFYSFLVSVRDADHDHLFSYVHPWESGWDQSIQWDFVFGGRGPSRFNLWRMIQPFRAVSWDQRAMIARSEFNIETADGNSLLARNLIFLSRIAQELARNDEAGAWLAEAEAVERTVLEELWDGEMFVDRCVIRGGHYLIRKRTPVAFFPLLLPRLRPAQKQKLLSLMADEFLTVPWPLPTASPRESAFDPNAYWRGTTWVNVNYFVILGLWVQTEHQIAQELVQKTVGMVERSGFREYYNPLTGRGLGVRGFSWSTLVVDLLRRSPC